MDAGTPSNKSELVKRQQCGHDPMEAKEEYRIGTDGFVFHRRQNSTQKTGV
jgi:hypothetical protein